ncbi:hypothetical protein RB195_002033 [Necator americanus]|uniref:Uncharacterized protein n=1 Tax=Necator americanus TaxID=51031 RepID=A0ABR1DH32_NECAM
MRKFWAEVVKEDLRTLGMNRQFRRDERVRRILNSYEWIDSVQALAENREGWAELCSRTPPFDEDALRGVNLEERQARLKNLAKLYFGNTTSTIRQNNNVASAVIDVDVKEFVTGSINDPSIEEINRKEGVSEFLFQGDINLTDEQLDWIERNIDIRKNTRSKRQVDSGARLWSNNRVFYFFDISIASGYMLGNYAKGPYKPILPP